MALNAMVSMVAADTRKYLKDGLGIDVKKVDDIANNHLQVGTTV